jgi:hypothetical protein
LIGKKIKEDEIEKKNKKPFQIKYIAIKRAGTKFNI